MTLTVTGRPTAIVGEMAWSYLTPEAKAAVVKLLENEGDGTLSDAATWADRIESDRKWDWAKPLHYANVAAGAETFDSRRDCPRSGCVVSAIIKYRDVLRDQAAPDDQKREALKFIAYFVGGRGANWAIFILSRPSSSNDSASPNSAIAATWSFSI